MALSKILGHPAIAAALTGYAGHTEGLRREREKRQQYNREVAKMGIDRKLGMIDRSVDAVLEGEKARGRLDPKSKHYDPAAHQQHKYRDWQMEGEGNDLRAEIERQKKELQDKEEELKVKEKNNELKRDQDKRRRGLGRELVAMIHEVKSGDLAPRELDEWMGDNPEVWDSKAYAQHEGLFESAAPTDDQSLMMEGVVPYTTRPIDQMYQNGRQEAEWQRATKEAQRQKSGWLGEEFSPYDPNRDRSADASTATTSAPNLGIQPSTADSLGASADTSGVAPADSAQVDSARVSRGSSDRSRIAMVDGGIGSSIGAGDQNTVPMPLTGSQTHDQQSAGNTPNMPLTGSQTHDQRQTLGVMSDQQVAPSEYGPKTREVIAALRAQKGLSEQEVVAMMKKSGLDLRQ